MIDVRIQSADFDPGRQLKRLEELHSGAVASFTGAVSMGAEIEAVQVEHYAALAKTELARIAEEAQERFSLSGVILIHRYGSFKLGDRLLFAAAACADAGNAQHACSFLIDALRARAPFWRKDLTSGGAARWFK
ncbi:MAG TPA: molybdenum cofactor biosynthesis protein MoaE [Allosphingosinicella sp.]|uniref:molybdenum cofactor biosynthesis protein MoaE n=1 Tax=Allosphingosinicella sp. TaxID=2823234 RepID=UPI002ED7B973